MRFPRVVYVLRHEATGKMYIGSTSNLKARLSQHLTELRRNKHGVPDLQSDYNLHANKEITVEVLGQITKWDERRIEWEWMQRYETHKRGKGYNYLDPHFKTGPKAPKSDADHLGK